MKITKKTSLLALLLLSSCSETIDKEDPHEQFNRDVLEFNLTVDKNILKPTASAYKEALSDDVREIVLNFLTTWKEPFYFVNHILTAEGESACNSLFRFVFNSTLGVLGLFDVAGEIGLEKAETSHKDTLKKWGMPTGDYLVLPVIGFSSTRDAIAEPISWFADPVGYLIGFPYMFAKAVLSEISNRAENADTIDPIIDNSMDLYSTTRSMYLQRYSPEPEDEEEKDDI
jgi:phospholipid-binding lipoprotein MlaA